MKKIVVIPFAIILCLLSACSSDKATLNISVSGSGEPFLLYFTASKLVPDTIYLPEHSPVTLDIMGKDVSQVRFMSGRSFTRLFVEPGREYALTLDFSPEGKLKMKVDDNALQQYYYIENGRDIYEYDRIEDYTAIPLDTIGSKMKENFQLLIDRDCELLEQIEMSKELRKAFRQDTELFWLTALSKAIRSNYVSYYQDGVRMYPEYGAVWKNIYQEHPIDHAYVESEWLYDYIQAYLFYELYAKAKKPDFRVQADYWNFQYETIYKNIGDKQTLERVVADFLIMDCLNNPANDKALVGHIRKFLDKYPDNANKTYLETYSKTLESI